MTKPTIYEVFGTNVTEDENYLHLSKADMTGVGLEPAASNSAQALLAAIGLMASFYLTEENQIVNPDIQITFKRGEENLITRNDQIYRRHILQIQLDTPDQNYPINPKDF